ncbi:MAG: CRISPR-associated helicase Cas3' [Clostridiales bacterium]|nr:CRISPR-associated helicase Cas3' [Clostridiales bacterium]
MKYLAHLDGERQQTIKEHLTGTALLSAKFAEAFGNRDWGYCCGMLHDIGKYSEAFQRKIQGNTGSQVDHSSAGAQVCFEMGGMYPYMSYCIAGHHAGLPDYGGSADEENSSSLMARRIKKLEDFQAYKGDIQIPELKTLPFDPKKSADPDFSLSVFIRMLYSCLVDADFLDTEAFMKDGKTERNGGEALDLLLKKLELYTAGWLKEQKMDTVNGRRTEILRHCLECGKKERGMFRLTVPTGGGKTIASLAFALRHGVENHMDRVIYVIPYTSIIEQNAAVFRKILGDENVLEHHCHVDFDSSEEFKPMQLAAENWDKPVVVTTNVQFFESLFANRSSRCRKLHNIANSVIIFDEAQMLPGDYLKPCIAMMEELVRKYRASIVLCTATQPALGPFFKSGMGMFELCPRMEEQFRFFERVTFGDAGIVGEDELAGILEQEYQVLCIVNTRKRAQNLYRKLEGEGVYHLSTTMYPKHRRRVLEEIRERLRAEEQCILIATSLVEAGVDLDFRSVYRELAGADSVIQAAGRCNREGKRPAEESVVTMFRFEDAETAPGQRQQMDVTKALLAEGWDISSLKGIEEYFRRLYQLRGESLDKKRIMEEFRKQKYNFARAAKEIKLIEEGTKTIFISMEDEAQALLEQLKYGGYTRTGMRRAGQYCIQVSDRDMEKLRGAGMIRLVSADMDDFYELTDKGRYTEKMGLDLLVDTAMALFI